MEKTTTKRRHAVKGGENYYYSPTPMVSVAAAESSDSELLIPFSFRGVRVCGHCGWIHQYCVRWLLPGLYLRSSLGFYGGEGRGEMLEGWGEGGRQTEEEE